MARQARVVLPGELHHALLLAQPNTQPLEASALRHRAVAILRDQAHALGLPLHGFVVLPDRWHVLATPQSPTQLTRFMQLAARQITRVVRESVGGTETALWAGRFRAGLISPDAMLDVLWAFDCWAGEANWQSAAPLHSASAAHWDGRTEMNWLTAHPQIWALGNTPFARQSRYGALREDFVGAGRASRVSNAAQHGWAYGSGEWLKEVEQRAGRALTPGSPGRKAGAKLTVPNLIELDSSAT